MIKFQIPDLFFSGFNAISELTTEDAGKIVKLLDEVPVGISLQEFQERFRTDETSELKQEIAEIVFSFGSILANKKTGEDIPELALGLTNAFKEKKEDVADEVVEQLNNNLLTIFKNAENLKKTFKAFQLLSANAHIYRGSKIMTDIRMLFEDDVENAPKCGVVLHQLKIEYLENEELKSFFVCLDKEDVISLTDSLQRALKKEESINRNQDKINFIRIK
jgi:hypothetical protein